LKYLGIAITIMLFGLFISSLPSGTSHAEDLKVTVSADESKEAWQTVYKVLVSPRCMNCHPVGDAPLQTDESRPHAMNITRQSEENGLACSTCHQAENTEVFGALGVAGPPGAPNWHLPEKDMPLIFQDRTSAELCEQLKRPEDNGNKTLDELLEHVTKDALVLWGWNPGAGRSVPPVPHDEFVAEFRRWMLGGAQCPKNE